MVEHAIDLIGWVGVALYVIAYYMVSAGHVRGGSGLYQWMNLAAAVGVAANAFYYGAFPSAVVNVIWFAIATLTLTNVLRRRGRADPDPGRPASAEGRRVHRLAFFAVGLLLVLLLTLSVLSMGSTRSRPLRPLTIYTGPWEPYLGPDLPGHGPVAAFVEEIFRAAHFRADLRFTAWETAEQAVEQGVAVAAFPFIDSRERKRRFLLTDPFLSFDYAVFYRRGEPDEPDAITKDLLRRWLEGRDVGRTFTIGVVEGYHLWEDLERAASDGHVTLDFPTIDRALEALAAGDVDLVPESTVVGRSALLRGDVPVDRTSIERYGVSQGMHLILADTPQGRRIRDRLNAAIERLERTGLREETQIALENASRVHDPHTDIEIVRPTTGETAGGATYRLARGTSGAVLRWAPGFTEESGPAPAEVNPRADADRCLVKLTNGPLAGRVLRVGVDDIRIREAESDP